MQNSKTSYILKQKEYILSLYMITNMIYVITLIGNWRNFFDWLKVWLKENNLRFVWIHRSPLKSLVLIRHQGIFFLFNILYVNILYLLKTFWEVDFLRHNLLVCTAPSWLSNLLDKESQNLNSCLSKKKKFEFI